MALPIILWGASLIATTIGAKKTYDAVQKNKEAERIIKKATAKYDKEAKKLQQAGYELNKHLEEFAKFKLNVFTNQINKLVKLLKRCKNTKSLYNHQTITFTKEEIKNLEKSVELSLEVLEGLAKGIASGALTALGAYGGVSMLATASTGAAISTLSGAAATNATLAWLGGGSIAAGGGGIAAGTFALSGLLAGPVIAVTGLVMDSKAEQNLTKVHEFEREVSIKIEKMRNSISEMKIVHQRINELGTIINDLVSRFDSYYKNIGFFERIKLFFGIKSACKSSNLQQLIILGKSLKMALDISLINEKGDLVTEYKNQIERIRL